MSFRLVLAALRPAPKQHRHRKAGRRAGPRPQLEPLDDRCLLSADVVLEWNRVLLDALKDDRLLPLYLARKAAIVHAAVYDAVNAIDRSYTPLFAHVHASRGASLKAAAAQAAHDTLVALSPAHKATFDATLAADLAGIPHGRANQGIAVGKAVAKQILAWRSTDGSDLTVNYGPGNDPGDWQPTPPAFAPAVAPQWGQVVPFCIPIDSAFRPPPQPTLTSAEYTAAFDEVKSLGAADSTTRTAEQSDIARFWYGTAGTFTSAGYWNQIAQEVAVQRGDSMVENARLFALLNLAQADSYFAIWDAKYTYDFWRPVTAIRAADTDGNPATAPEPAWTSFLGTPAFPSYVSGHSGHSAAAAAVLGAYFKTDDVCFTLTTDSLPGVTRSFESFSAAVHEVSDSRVFAGIHWRFDVTAGETVGYQVGNYVAANWLLPVRRHHDHGSHASAARIAVTPRSQVPSDARVGVTPRFVAPVAPARTPDTPMLGAPLYEAAAPVLQPAPQRGGRIGFRLAPL
jgi:membrane-associated phospholipid phosphatase